MFSYPSSLFFYAVPLSSIFSDGRSQPIPPPPPRPSSLSLTSNGSASSDGDGSFSPPPPPPPMHVPSPQELMAPRKTDEDVGLHRGGDRRRGETRRRGHETALQGGRSGETKTTRRGKEVLERTRREIAAGETEACAGARWSSAWGRSPTDAPRPGDPGTTAAVVATGSQAAGQESHGGNHALRPGGEAESVGSDRNTSAE